MNNNGIDLGGVVFVALTILKLTDVIDWSWWWITAPVWVPAVITLIGVATLAVIEAVRG